MQQNIRCLDVSMNVLVSVQSTVGLDNLSQDDQSFIFADVWLFGCQMLLQSATLTIVEIQTQFFIDFSLNYLVAVQFHQIWRPDILQPLHFTFYHLNILFLSVFDPDLLYQKVEVGMLLLLSDEYSSVAASTQLALNLYCWWDVSGRSLHPAVLHNKYKDVCTQSDLRLPLLLLLVHLLEIHVLHTFFCRWSPIMVVDNHPLKYV